MGIHKLLVGICFTPAVTITEAWVRGLVLFVWNLGLVWAPSFSRSSTPKAYLFTPVSKGLGAGLATIAFVLVSWCFDGRCCSVGEVVSSPVFIKSHKVNPALVV